LYNIKNEINLNKKNIKNRFEDINFIIEKEKFYKLFIFKNKKFEESEINGIKCYFNLINLELKIYNFNSSIIDGYGFIFEYDYAINKAFQKKKK
jgi:transcription elongation factor